MQYREQSIKLGITLNEPLVIYMTLYKESVSGQTDHFADAFVRENFAHG